MSKSWYILLIHSIFSCHVFQVIVYRDYLPNIVGTDAVKLRLDKYTGYDSLIDPSVSSIFSTAANRFAHATLQPFYFRVDENLRDDPRYPPVALHTALFAPWRILFEGEFIQLSFGEKKNFIQKISLRASASVHNI